MAGYRVAALLATAGALYFASWFGSTGGEYHFGAWRGTYLLFAALMLPGLLTSLVIREPQPLSQNQAPAQYGLHRQLLSVLVLIVLLVSVPALFTQLYDTEFSLLASNPFGLLTDDRAFLRACSTAC